jgi:hypothetical protein
VAVRPVSGERDGQAEGRFAGTSPLLGDLLGRRPRTVRDLLADRAAA